MFKWAEKIIYMPSRENDDIILNAVPVHVKHNKHIYMH